MFRPDTSSPYAKKQIEYYILTSFLSILQDSVKIDEAVRKMGQISYAANNEKDNIKLTLTQAIQEGVFTDTDAINTEVVNSTLDDLNEDDLQDKNLKKVNIVIERFDPEVLAKGGLNGLEKWSTKDIIIMAAARYKILENVMSISFIDGTKASEQQRMDYNDFIKNYEKIAIETLASIPASDNIEIFKRNVQEKLNNTYRNDLKFQPLREFKPLETNKEAIYKGLKTFLALNEKLVNNHYNLKKLEKLVKEDYSEKSWKNVVTIAKTSKTLNPQVDLIYRAIKSYDETINKSKRTVYDYVDSFADLLRMREKIDAINSLKKEMEKLQMEKGFTFSKDGFFKGLPGPSWPSGNFNPQDKIIAYNALIEYLYNNISTNESLNDLLERAENYVIAQPKKNDNQHFEKIKIPYQLVPADEVGPEKEYVSALPSTGSQAKKEGLVTLKKVLEWNRGFGQFFKAAPTSQKLFTQLKASSAQNKNLYEELEGGQINQKRATKSPNKN